MKESCFGEFCWTHTPLPTALRLRLLPKKHGLKRYSSAMTHSHKQGHTHINTAFNFLPGYEKICVNNAWWDRERGGEKSESRSEQEGRPG